MGIGDGGCEGGVIRGLFGGRWCIWKRRIEVEEKDWVGELVEWIDEIYFCFLPFLLSYLQIKFF